MNDEKNKIGTVSGVEVYELCNANIPKGRTNCKVYEVAGLRMVIDQLVELQRTVFILQVDAAHRGGIEHHFHSCREIDVLAFAQLVLDHTKDPVREGSWERLTSKLEEIYETFPPITTGATNQEYKNPLINPGMIVLTNMDVFPLPATETNTAKYRVNLYIMPVTPRLIIKHAAIACVIHFKGNQASSISVKIESINNIKLPEIFADLRELEIMIPVEMSFNLINIMQVVVAHWNEEFTKKYREFIDLFTFGQQVGFSNPPFPPQPFPANQAAWAGKMGQPVPGQPGMFFKGGVEEVLNRDTF